MLLAIAHPWGVCLCLATPTHWASASSHLPSPASLPLPLPRHGVFLFLRADVPVGAALVGTRAATILFPTRVSFLEGCRRQAGRHMAACQAGAAHRGGGAAAALALLAASGGEAAGGARPRNRQGRPR